MQSKNYFRISRILFYASVSFICASFLSFFWTLIISSRIYFDPSSNGLKEFVSYYQPQIALAGVGIALFALWITSERMKQTKEQIDVMADNNKFNNFFKHRENFIAYFCQNKFLIEIAKGGKKDIQKVAMEYYEYFFYKSYSDFRTTLNDDAFNNCVDIGDKIESSSVYLETVSISEMKVSEVLMPEFNIHFPSYIIREFLKNLVEKQQFHFSDYKEIKANEQRFNYYTVLTAYYAYNLIIDALLYSGELRQPSNPFVFTLNVQDFVDELGIDIMILDR